MEAGQGGRKRRRGLPRGPQALPREQVAADQRERLFEALLEVVNERGFAGTTISGLVQRAGVSRRSFYEHYENKEQCLLAAFDDSVERLARRMVAGLNPDADVRAQIEGLLRGLFDATVERPQAARLVCVEIGAAGDAGAERWAQGAARLEQVIGHLFEQAPGEGTIPEPVAKAVVGALRKIVYARVIGARSKRALRAELNRALPGLVGWIVGYYPSPPGIARRPRRQRSAAARRAGAGSRAAGARGGTARTGQRAGGRAPGSLVTLSATGAQALPRGLPSGEHNLPRSFVEHNQRERIFDAIANLTAVHGYPAVGLEDVASQAAVSLRTFYSHFESKEEAFVATYEVGHARAVNVCIEAFAAQPTWPRGVHAGRGRAAGVPRRRARLRAHGVRGRRDRLPRADRARAPGKCRLRGASGVRHRPGGWTGGLRRAVAHRRRGDRRRHLGAAARLRRARGGRAAWRADRPRHLHRPHPDPRQRGGGGSGGARAAVLSPRSTPPRAAAVVAPARH